jgi:hypothetical protein
MKEIDILKNLLELFVPIRDFTIEHDVHISDRRGIMCLDAIINYGNQRFACVEIKNDKYQSKELKNHIEKQLLSIQKKICTLKFFFCLLGKKYYFLDSDNKLVEKTEKEVFELLIHSVEDHADICDELIKPFKSKIVNKGTWREYGEIFKKHLKEGCLRKYGNIVFLDKNEEMELLRDLLIYEYGKEMPKDICRYTSDKTFCLSIGNKFRLNSVEAMNDSLETKVINSYQNLSVTQNELSEYIYKGFIMSFSSINRKDKLSSWYMYGQQAKGVCFIVNPKHNLSQDLFIAPIAYLPAPSEKRMFNILDFINDIMDFSIMDSNCFRLRYWHFWKHFFKYDYYKEEEEVRVLLLQKDNYKLEWSEEYSTPYYYIEKTVDELPFEISEVILGPKCESRQEIKNYIASKFGGEVKICDSEIIGYR